MKSSILAVILVALGASASASAQDNLDPVTRYQVDSGLQATPARHLGAPVPYTSVAKAGNLDPATRYGLNTGWTAGGGRETGHVFTGKRYSGDNTDPLTRYGVNHGL